MEVGEVYVSPYNNGKAIFRVSKINAFYVYFQGYTEDGLMPFTPGVPISDLTAFLIIAHQVDLVVWMLTVMKGYYDITSTS